MQQKLVKSAYIHLIEVILYFVVVGFLFGSLVLFLCLAPLLLIMTLAWIAIVVCMWPVLLPVMLAIKHTHIVRKISNFAIEQAAFRRLVLALYRKACNL